MSTLKQSKYFFPLTVPINSVWIKCALGNDFINKHVNDVCFLMINLLILNGFQLEFGSFSKNSPFSMGFFLNFQLSFLYRLSEIIDTNNTPN